MNWIGLLHGIEAFGIAVVVIALFLGLLALAIWFDGPDGGGWCA